MPPLSQEFLHHLHELMVETSDRLREELHGYKHRLVWEAQQRGNSAGIPAAYSDAALYAYRTRVEATIQSYLEALQTCSITVDAAVERDMLRQISSLTAAPTYLTLPPGVKGPTVPAVQAEHARKMERAANALRREAANRLRELKMKARPNVPATMPMTPPQPFTIASVAPTLAVLRALPLEEQALLLLRRLVQIYPTVRNVDKFKKSNILLPNDNYQIAMGYSASENMPVRQHLLGGPWNRLVVHGYLVDPGDQGFHDITPEGFAAAEEAAMPKQAASPPPATRSGKLVDFEHPDRPVAFMSYSWETEEHKKWVLALAERLYGNGINVILDQWHLRMGMDKTLFMERAVAESDFVLIICTPTYAQKANDRRGGVGYEAMIITGELAEDILQTKFIPVLRQGEWDKASLPRWLKTRTGADLRGTPYIEGQYNLLVRELHREYMKPPPAGPKPDFSSVAQSSAQRAATEQRAAAQAAPAVQDEELTAQQWFERGLATAKPEPEAWNRPGFLFKGPSVGIDIGTKYTRIYIEEKGVALNEPSIVAIDRSSGEVKAAGADALNLLSKSSGYELLRPLKESVVCDPDLAAKMLRYFFAKIHLRAVSRAVFAVPVDTTKANLTVLRGVAKLAKIKKTAFVESCFLVAIDFGLPITDPSVNMVADVGGGTADIAVVTLSGIVGSRSVRTAGNQMNEAITNYLKRKYNLLISDQTAEHIKIELGSAYPLDKPMTMEINGRNLANGVPRTITIDDSEIREALSECVSEIMQAIREALEHTPPELMPATIDCGIFLAGGGALLKNLDKRIREETGLQAFIANDPSCSVVRGFRPLLSGDGKLMEKLRLGHP
jgi:rod shape-determining protein MreB and related proteins